MVDQLIDSMVVLTHMPNLPLPKRQSVRIHRSFLSSASSDIVETPCTEMLPRLLLELIGISRHSW